MQWPWVIGGLGVLATLLVYLWLLKHWMDIRNRLVSEKHDCLRLRSDIDVYVRNARDQIPQLRAVLVDLINRDQYLQAFCTYVQSDIQRLGLIRTLEENDREFAQRILPFLPWQTLVTAAVTLPEQIGMSVVQPLRENIQQTIEAVKTARLSYNRAVGSFNTKLETFPYNLVTKSLGLEEFNYVDADEEILSPPDLPPSPPPLPKIPFPKQKMEKR